MKKPKKRIIYTDSLSVEDMDEYKNEYVDTYGETPTEDELDTFIHNIKIDEYCNVINELKEFFSNKNLDMTGIVSFWNGHRVIVPEKGDFGTLLSKACTDCLELKIYDCNGHLYIENHHHDGTNHFEIKEIQHKRYVLPRFCEKIWGCKPREFEK